MRALPYVLVILLISSGHAQWNQAGGDPERSGASGIAADQLDILASVGLDSDLGAGAGVLDTPAGPVAWNGCGFTVIDVTGRDAHTGERRECVQTDGANLTIVAPTEATGALHGYDPRSGHAYVCLDGIDASLQAWTLNASLQWQAGAPATSVPIGGAPLAGPTLANGFVDDWRCTDVIVAEDFVVAAFTSTEAHSISAFSHAGQREWATQVPVSAFLDAPSTAADQLIAPAVQYHPETLTKTDTGFVVTGRLRSDEGMAAIEAFGLAWLDRAGKLVGVTLVAEEEATVVGERPTALGNRAAIVVGERLAVVDPSRDTATFVPIPTPSFGAPSLPAATWTQHGLFVPTEGGALVFDADPTQVNIWPGYQGGRAHEAVTTADGDVYTVISRQSGNDHIVELMRVSMPDAVTVQRIPLPITTADVKAQGIHLTPLSGDRLFVWDDDGDAVLLGPSGPGAGQRSPTLSPEGIYPPVAGPFVVDVTPARSSEKVLVAWGDGTVEEAPPGGGRMQHTYLRAGQHTIRATELNTEGTTATTSLVVLVGSTAPAAPNWIQTAFSQEHQEVTFTVLGVLVSGLGVLFGVLAATRGRRRLDKELKRLDQIGDRGRKETLEAVAELSAYKTRIREQLARGKLHDSQFTILDAKARDTLDVLRRRILGGFAGRLSEGFLRTFDLAMRDGRVDRDEAADLIARAGTESLSTADRDRLVRLIRNWQG